jgi:hypothetical protein
MIGARKAQGPINGVPVSARAAGLGWLAPLMSSDVGLTAAVSPFTSLRKPPKPRGSPPPEARVVGGKPSRAESDGWGVLRSQTPISLNTSRALRKLSIAAGTPQ